MFGHLFAYCRYLVSCTRNERTEINIRNTNIPFAAAVRHESKIPTKHLKKSVDTALLLSLGTTAEVGTDQ
jgi:hypothetical protein